MNSLQSALDSYRELDPAGWVAAYRNLPLWAGGLFVGVGIALLVVGGGRPFRFIAAVLGAALGYLWAPVVLAKLGISTGSQAAPSAAAAFLAVLGLVFPPGLTFFAVGVPVGLAVGKLLPETDWLAGFAPALLVSGLIAAAANRVISSVVSSVLGAWLLVLGLLVLLSQAGTFVSRVTQQPWGVIIAAVLFAVAGSVFQLAIRPSPEAAETRAREKELAKKRAAERKALERRWGKS